MSEDDLDLIPTADLIEALHRRLGQHGALLVASTTTDGNESIVWRGGQTTALGMAVRAQHAMLNTKADPIDPEGT